MRRGERNEATHPVEPAEALEVVARDEAAHAEAHHREALVVNAQLLREVAQLFRRLKLPLPERRLGPAAEEVRDALRRTARLPDAVVEVGAAVSPWAYRTSMRFAVDVDGIGLGEVVGGYALGSAAGRAISNLAQRIPGQKQAVSGGVSIEKGTLMANSTPLMSPPWPLMGRVSMPMVPYGKPVGA